MKKRWLLLLVLILLLLFTQSALAKEYHLKLLAVQERNNTLIGSDADLYLELRPGTGRVFLDTFPFTKADTQVSTRFAKEIACKHYKLPCERYDFIYTIKARSTIVGGPSAGAAMAALTTIAMLKLDYHQDVAVTGTINSGATIGPVGGVKEKLEAAKNINMRKVLIAKGTAMLDIENEDNTSNETEQLNLINYAKDDLSLTALEVMELDEILLHLTDINLNGEKVEVKENPQYQIIMKKLQELLCDRSIKMEKEIHGEDIFFNSTISEEVLTRRGRATNSTRQKDYYSGLIFDFTRK